MTSPIAPPFSPISASIPGSVMEYRTNNIEYEANDCDISAEIIDVQDVSQEWYGFKLVGDNIDKNIHPSLQQRNSQTNSLHYFYSFAILTCKAYITPTNPNINYSKLLPSAADITQYKNYAEILMASSGVPRGEKGAIAPPFLKENTLGVEQSVTS